MTQPSDAGSIEPRRAATETESFAQAKPRAVSAVALVTAKAPSPTAANAGAIHQIGPRPAVIVAVPTPSENGLANAQLGNRSDIHKKTRVVGPAFGK